MSCEDWKIWLGSQARSVWAAFSSCGARRARSMCSRTLAFHWLAPHPRMTRSNPRLFNLSIVPHTEQGELLASTGRFVKSPARDPGRWGLAFRSLQQVIKKAL